jgi:hypothetical protein
VAVQDIDPVAFVDQLIQMLLFGLTTGPARDTPLPAKSGPWVWEQIRDEMLAAQAAERAGGEDG